jgi:hypothetical protein
VTAATMVAALGRRAGDQLTVHVGPEESPRPVTFRSPVASEDGDLLLPLALLPAMVRGDRLRVAEPLSPQLLDAVPAITDVATTFDRYAWGLDLRPVLVEAPARVPDAPSGGRGLACFFSGGVDSTFSARAHRKDLTALVFVHGFDVPLDDAPLRHAVSTTLRAAAEALGLPLIEVEADLHRFAHGLVPWSAYHGSAMATVAHLLAPLADTFLVPASDTYATLSAYGSHPLLDPLWSSESVSILHDGCVASRVDKVRSFGEDDGGPDPLSWLRVCWRNPGGAYNCGRCPKCVSTMVALRMAGLLERAPTFPSTLDLARVAALDLSSPGSGLLWSRYVRDLDASGTDPALARAIRVALATRRAHPVWRSLKRAAAGSPTRSLAADRRMR